MYLRANSMAYHHDGMDQWTPKPEMYAAMAAFYPERTAKEIARAFGVSVRTVRRAIAKHKKYKGSPTKDLAAALGVSTRTIQRRKLATVAEVVDARDLKSCDL